MNPVLVLVGHIVRGRGDLRLVRPERLDRPVLGDRERAGALLLRPLRAAGTPPCGVTPRLPEGITREAMSLAWASARQWSGAVASSRHSPAA